jgi:Flp pilus assembly protein TadG
MALLTVLFLGMAGLTLDLGHAYVCYRELQASTDAAALAGAYQLSLPTATTGSLDAAVQAASSMTGGKNVNINLPQANVTTTAECLNYVTASGVICTGTALDANAVQVVQTAVVPTYFIRALAAFGINSASSITLKAESTAAAKGAQNAPYNIAIIIDTTASMGTVDSDAACGGKTRIDCALSGVQTLLQALSPCSVASEKGTCVGFDTVSLFTFPNIQANAASDDTSCPTKNPPIPNYTTPARGATWTAPTGTAGTYQVTGFLDNYSNTNAAGGTLSTTSALGVATGASTCKGLQTPGGDGTYYAAAIYAAQSSLIADQLNNPGSLNAMVIVSDGDADSGNITVTGTVQAAGTGSPAFTVAYPSTTDQCQQAIDAAKYASANGTTVYTIAYGAANSGCASDKSGPLKGLSPCTALQDMATNLGDFYSDSNSSQNKGQCGAPDHPSLTLNQIFTNVQTGFTNSRLIPNGVT